MFQINDLLRRTTPLGEVKFNPYERLGFTRNPFPTKPGVVIGSPNPAENGSIYLPDLRENEQRKFEQLLIPSPIRTQVRSIAFLMDYATRRGRGIGKTAFLNYQCKRIMKDLGKELSSDSQVIFATYVLPPPDKRCRKMWQFNRLISRSLAEQGVIATATWRLRAFSDVIPLSIIEEAGDNLQFTIGSDDWLKDKGVDILWGLSHKIRGQLQGLGIKHDLIEAITKYGHSIEDFLKYIDSLSDYYWLRDEGQLLYNDLIKVFNAAGFTRGLILVDNMEEITPAQNIAERREFAEALRYFFMDGQCENARISFFGLLLTIHPYLQELLTPHWEASGLDRFAALSRELAPEYTIYFEPLNQESALPLARIYLDNARIQENQKGSLRPFTEEAVQEALIISGRVPGKFLTLLNNAIEKALKEERDEIGAAEIKGLALIRPPKEPEESDSIEKMPFTEVDLQE